MHCFLLDLKRKGINLRLLIIQISDRKKSKKHGKTITGFKKILATFYSNRKKNFYENIKYTFFLFRPYMKPEYYLKLITETGVFKYVTEFNTFKP